MSKKIMLLALGAVSLMMLALPVMASAQVPLHVTPQPVGAKTIHGVGPALLINSDGSTLTCDGFKGTVTFTSTTGGTMSLTFGPNCRESIFGTSCTSTVPTPAEPTGNISTTLLRFDLVTLANGKPGVLITPATDGRVAHFICAGGLVNVTTDAHVGMLGEITAPGCGGSSTQTTIDFNRGAAHGQQQHTLVAGTPNVIHSLTKEGSGTSAQEWHATVTLGANTTLTCT